MYPNAYSSISCGTELGPTCQLLTDVDICGARDLGFHWKTTSSYERRNMRLNFYLWWYCALIEYDCVVRVVFELCFVMYLWFVKFCTLVASSPRGHYPKTFPFDVFIFFSLLICIVSCRFDLFLQHCHLTLFLLSHFLSYMYDYCITTFMTWRWLVTLMVLMWDLMME